MITGDTAAPYRALAKLGQSITGITDEIQAQKDALDYSKGQRQVDERINAAYEELTGDEDSDKEVWDTVQKDVSGIQYKSKKVNNQLTMYVNRIAPGVQQTLMDRHQGIVKQNTHDEFETEGQIKLAAGDVDGYQDILDRRFSTKDISQKQYEALTKSSLGDMILAQVTDLISNANEADTTKAMEVLNDTKVIPGLDLSTDQKKYRNKLYDIAEKQIGETVDATGQQYWTMLQNGQFTQLEDSLNDPNNPLPIDGAGGKSWWFNLMQSRLEKLNTTDVTEETRTLDAIIFNHGSVDTFKIRDKAKLGVHGGLSINKVAEYDEKLKLMQDKNSALNTPIAKTFFNELRGAKLDRVFSTEQAQNENRYGQSLDSLTDYFVNFRKKNDRDPSLTEAQEHYENLVKGYRSAAQPFTEAKVQTTMGELQSGGATTIYGTVIKFSKSSDAVNHALRNLGPNWQEIAPDAVRIIKEKWPEANINVKTPVIAKEEFEVGEERMVDGDSYRREADGQWHRVAE